MKSPYDTEIMTSSAIGMSLVSDNCPNWPHCTRKFSNYTHTGRKGPLLWVKLVYTEPSFHTKCCSPSSFTITVNQLRRVLSFSVTLLCLPVLSVLFLLQPTFQSVQLLRGNPPIYPAALLDTPTWLFGIKEATVSTSFILLSPFWFLNWKNT
jgi:hypothetical protein